MNTLEHSQPTTFDQTYLIERDAGLLCRILGLYGARSIDVLAARYDYAAKDVMKLHVSVGATQQGMADTLRVLVEKASTFAGVIVACEHEAIAPLAA